MSREFWIDPDDRWAADNDFGKNAIHVREVDPAYDAAVEKLVKNLNEIMIAALNGDETTTELNCFHLAQEALEKWSRVK